MPGLYNGGREGPRSGPPAGFIQSTVYSNLVTTTESEPILLWSAILAVFKNAVDKDEALSLLEALGIDPGKLDEYRTAAKQAYQSICDERQNAR